MTDRGIVSTSGRADVAKVAWEYVTVAPAFERNIVRTVGLISSGLVALSVLAVTAVALRSIPDIKHYRRIRNM